MKYQLVPKHTGWGSILIIVLVLLFTACGGNGDKASSTDSQISTYTFKSETLSFDYGTEWMISGKTDTSVTLTHNEKPGDVILSAQWFEDKKSEQTDITQLYKNQLDLMAGEVQRLEDINIGSINAERYASLISGIGEMSVVTLHVLFNSEGTLYLVMFSAGPDDFVAYTASANEVIDTIRVK
jgi:hypothetical protein